MELIFTILALPFVALAILGIAIVWGFAAVNRDNWGQATLTTVLGAFIVSHMFGVNFEFIKENAGNFALGFGVYLVVGVVWSFMKWFSTLRRVADQVVESKERFIAFNKVKQNIVIPESFLEDSYEDGPDRRQEFASYVNWFSGIAAVGITKEEIIENVRPKAAQNKASITGWIAFWPLSAVWTLIDDPVRRLIDYIFARFKNLYELMSKSVFKGI